ncbi:MAG: hypothetical protein JXQ75_03145 [Phycisphaerae bacterium]|nr:hypothetical protein [Phycisphaerae bacterium]
MTDLLGHGLAWLDTQRHLHLSRAVLYCRGADSVELLATVGKTDVDVVDGAGSEVRTQATDFLIRAQDLIVAGQRILPEVGDRITVETSEATRVYEVLDLAGAGHTRPCDPAGNTLRIHTKCIEEVFHAG